MSFNAADATVVAACITGGGYLLLGLGQRATFKRTGNIDDKIDEIIAQQARTAECLAEHTVSDDRNFSALRDRVGGRPPKRWGAIKMGLALLALFLR